MRSLSLAYKHELGVTAFDCIEAPFSKLLTMLLHPRPEDNDVIAVYPNCNEIMTFGAGMQQRWQQVATRHQLMQSKAFTTS